MAEVYPCMALTCRGVVWGGDYETSRLFSNGGHTKSRVQKPGFRRIRMLLHESLGVHIPAGEQGRPTVRVPVLSSTTAPDHSDLYCIATMHFNGGLAVV